ncbi:TPA: ESPR domain-containing protein, partial [Escherichia coli]|nr:ESPR domain-containing protein [Escherichia coli]HEC5174921.1 ESPR domain-containing protein [Escherichia coli]
MNTIYRLVWNSARRLWVVASELTRAKKKSATTGAALILCGFSAVAGTLSGTQYITGDGNSKNWQELFPVTGLEGDKVSTPSAWEINNEIWGKKATAYLFTAKDTHIKGGQGKLGGIAIEGNYFYLKNNGGVHGGDGLAGGIAIHGYLSDIKNLAGGKITGGSGGVTSDNIYGSPDGSWRGGDALVITHISSLDNQGIVQGGDGGASGLGGAGVSSQDSHIENYKMIAGGKGGDAIPGDETSPIKGGSGGDAIKGNQTRIYNALSGAIIGGNGGAGSVHNVSTIYSSAGYGGNGGAGISGNNNTINNDGHVIGGNGNNGGDGEHGYTGGGYGGTGGDAVTGTGLTVNNTGQILGGTGGTGGNSSPDQLFSPGGQGGSAGQGISGDDITVTNSGLIQGGNGGNGGYAYKAGRFENGGKGGDAIKGSNLHIANSGQLIAGKGGNDQADGAALRFTGGVNTLTLYKGNDITGNIVLEQNTSGNSLSITSDVDTTVKGDLSVASGANILIQQGQGVNFAGSVFLEENATFINKNTLLNVSGIDNRGGTLTASNVNVSSWLLNDIRS